ncbi:MAG: hypothetical protein ABIA37_04640 [Candidatus Woesearchaeota archaeon]
MAKDESNGIGIASLVLGIVSIVFCWAAVFGLAAGILGLILSMKQRKICSNGIATAGFVTSIIGTIFSAIYVVFWILLGAFISAILS